MNYAVMLFSRRRQSPAKSGGSPAPVPRAGLFIWATFRMGEVAFGAKRTLFRTGAESIGRE